MDAERGRKRMTGLFSYTKTPIGAEQPPILRVKRLSPDAKLPTYATDGSACMDFYANLDYDDSVPANGTLRIPTGVAVEVPPGWAMCLFSRSGHGFNMHLRLSNCVGIIDADYRGEVKVQLHNDSPTFRPISRHERIAQAMLVRAPRCTILEVEELTETARGTGGFGSTGR